MKQTTADRLIRMALLLGSAAALTHELFKAFLIPHTFTDSPWPLLGLDTAVLLPLILCVRGRKSLYFSVFAWVSAGIALILYALFHLTDILASPQTLLYPWLFYLVAMPVAILGFYAVRTRTGTLFWAAGGLIGITYLAAGGYDVDIRVTALFCLFCAALFLDMQLPPSRHRLRRLGALNGFLGAAFLVTLAILAGLEQLPAVQDMQRLQIKGLADLFKGGLSGSATFNSPKGGTTMSADQHDDKQEPAAAVDTAAAVPEAPITAPAAAAASDAAAVAKAERERVQAILGCEEAKERGSFASHLAFSTEMSVDEARKLLLAAAKEVQAKAEGDPLAAAMAASGGGTAVMPGTNQGKAAAAPAVSTAKPDVKGSAQNGTQPPATVKKKTAPAQKAPAAKAAAPLDRALSSLAISS